MPISAEAMSPSHIDRTGVWSMYERVCMSNMFFTCSPKGHTLFAVCVCVCRWQNTFVSCINIAFFFFNYAWKWNDGNFQIPRKKTLTTLNRFVPVVCRSLVNWNLFAATNRDILYCSRCHFHILIHMIFSLSFVCAVCI